MHYALDLRTFIYSHYFYLGLRVSLGILGLTLLTAALAGEATAMTVCIGALCASLMDMPSPLRHKVNEMMAATLVCTAVTLVVSLAAPIHWLMLIVLVVISFFASMMVVYGKKSMPLQLSALFIMTFSMEHDMTPHQALVHSAVFLSGGLAYVAYAMAVAWFLRHRIKQQVLAEALFELAHYVGLKANFYDTRHNLNEQFNRLVRHQSLLADRHQAARDLILRGHDEQRDAITIQVHVGMLDVYELVLSTHTDYALLRQHLADSDALRALHDLTIKAARDIETIAYAVTRNKPSYATVDYRPELAVMDASLAELRQMERDGENTHEMQSVLLAQRQKVEAIIHMIGRLHLASQSVLQTTRVWEGADMGPFLSQQKYELRLMFANMHLDSPVFRFAIRLSLAICAGLVISNHVPYAAHSYWIALTVVIILKPTYAVTKQRRTDRLFGTVIGCMVTAALLQWANTPLVIYGALFLSIVAMPTFISLHYRYSAVAVSIMILLQMHLIAPSEHLISERLLDTFIGAAVATLFSFLLASWEYHALPRLIRQVLDANRGYMDASFALLRGDAANDFPYRIERKRLMDSLSGLSASLMRMLDEPASKQRSAEELNQFIVQNYLLVAHVAALRSLLQRHAGALPAGAVHALLGQSQQQIRQTLSSALLQHGSTTPAAGPATEDVTSAVVTAEIDLLEDAGAREQIDVGAGWAQLQRSMRLLQLDADRITVHSTAIVRNVLLAGAQ